jgi:hypothetical protein
MFNAVSGLRRKRSGQRRFISGYQNTPSHTPSVYIQAVDYNRAKMIITQHGISCPYTAMRHTVSLRHLQFGI